MKIQRYTFDEVYNAGLGAVPDENGRWVKWDDVSDLIQKDTDDTSRHQNRFQSQ